MNYNFSLAADVVESLPPARHVVTFTHTDEALLDLARHQQVSQDFHDYMRDIWRITASLRPTTITEQKIPITMARMVLRPKFGSVSDDDALLTASLAMIEWAEEIPTDPDLNAVFYRSEHDNGNNHGREIVTARVMSIFNVLGVMRTITPQRFLDFTQI